MTINKSQGQSFKVVGLDLETVCFPTVNYMSDVQGPEIKIN